MTAKDAQKAAVVSADPAATVDIDVIIVVVFAALDIDNQNGSTQSVLLPHVLESICQKERTTA